MAHCINKSHPEFLKLVDSTNINPIILASKVSVWQEKNGLDKFPTITELNIIKPGVEELFDSNPELANQVYEALGFGKFITDTLSNIERIKKYLPKTIELTTPQEFADYGYTLKSNYANEIGTILRSFADNNITDEEFSDRLLGVLEEQEFTSEERVDKIKILELKSLALTVKYRNLILSNKENILKNILKKQSSKKFELRKVNDREDSFIIDTDYGGSGIGFNPKTNEIWENDNKSILNTNINQITPQQKQQALQLYSQYLDTIFPDSKVKDIVYHGSPKISKTNAYKLLNNPNISEEEYNKLQNPIIEKFDKSKIGEQSNSGIKNGFYFTTNKKVANWNNNNRIYNVILNITNAIQKVNYEGEQIDLQHLKLNVDKYSDWKNYEAVIFENVIDGLDKDEEKIGDTIVVFEPEQIHILGSKQDIEGFKEFVGGKNLSNMSNLGKLEGDLMQSEKGQIGVNKQQLLMLLGPTMYNKPLAQVAVKELLQNSFDAVKARQNISDNKNTGNINIKVDYDNRTISIQDDGIGMTPDIVKNAFLSIGGTNKEGLDVSERSGGFGLAKVQFLLGSEYVKVSTVRDGIKTTLEASAVQLYNDDFEIFTEKTNESNGSFVEVKIPESYITPEGTKREIDFPGRYANNDPYSRFDILDKPLIGDANIKFAWVKNNKTQEKVLPIGINSDETTLPPLFSKIDFKWGSADLYMSTEKKENPKHRILSSGIYQFSHNFRFKDWENIPYDIVVNIKPSVSSTSEQYPFNNQREGFKNTVQEDIKSLNNYLKKYASGEAEKDAKAVFSNITGLPKVDPNKVLTPEEREKLYADVEKTIEENKKRRIEQGLESAEEAVRKIYKLVIDETGVKNQETGEVEVSKEKNYGSSFKAEKEIEKVESIETKNFNPSLPQYHNNTNFDYLSIEGAAEFFSDFGSVVLEMVRFAGNELGYNYEKLKSEDEKFFAGVSIDKQYGGVHVRKIINAIFVNPLAFDVSSLEEAVGVALHVAIHEINHTTVSGEGAEFTTALGVLYGKIYATGKYGLYEGLFRSVYKKHFETFKKLKYEYDKSSTKNLSESFKGEQIETSSFRDVQRDVNDVSARQPSEKGYRGNQEGDTKDKTGDVILSNFISQDIEGFKEFVSGKTNVEAQVETQENEENNEEQTDLIPQIEELNNFQLYEDLDKLCGEGVCNYTTTESTKKLKEVGLNPFPNEYSGDNLSVRVKSPLGDFFITHYVSAVAINNSIYIYDMPQNEFISDKFYGKGSVPLKTTYKPRLIPLTLDSIKANYNLDSEYAAKFIRSILTTKKSNIKPSFKSYIEDNINNSSEYILDLENQISKENVLLDSSEEYTLKNLKEEDLKNQIREAKLSKKLTSKEETKVINFLRNKLKFKTKDYLPTKTTQFTLENIIKSVTGLKFQYNKENFDKALEEFKNYTDSEEFLIDIWRNYSNAKNNLDSIDKSLDYLFSFNRLLNGFFKLAESIGIDEALSKYDKNQEYKLRVFLPSDIKTKYKSDKQAIFLLKKRYSNLDNLTKDLNLEFGKSLTDIYKDKFKLSAIYEKANTVLNYLKAVDFDASYIYESIENEAKRRYKYFSQQGGEVYFQQEPQSTKKADEEINTLVKNFLAKLGISVKSVDEIRNAEGNKLSAVAKADMLNKIIEIIDGKADITTLPEEAAHFFVEMLGENNPLFIEMMSKITGYKIYQDTVQTYRNNSQYRNKDGSLNINKLKKEAIGKLIAQHIVKHSAVGESESKIKEFNNWWDKLLNFIKKLFTKSVTDPFVQSAESILKADISNLSKDNIQETGEYYQLKGIEKLEQHQKDIQLDNSVDPKTKQKRHIYTINGKDIKSSVTSKYVDAWLKRKFPNDNRTETQKKIDLLKADYGDVIHEMMQDIIDVYVDPQTHLVREIPAAPSSKYFDTDPYKLFEKYIQDLIKNYNAPGTKFMREVKIYDPIKDVAGSIDLLVIEPDGTANIYDWKSQEIGKEQTELKPYKETMYRIQLQEYKKILQTHYDIKNFGLVRAIPIRVVYSYTGREDQRTIEGINKIEMGSFDLSSIPDNKNYLLPVTLRDEKSDDKELSEYIKKLSSVMDILENKKYRTEDERRRKKVELAKYKNAVRDLQLRGDIRKFIELGNYEINKYKRLITGGNLTEKDALESLEILQVFTNTTRVFNNYMNELKKIKKETKDEYVKEVVDEIINDYNQMNTSADIVLGDMQNAIKNIAVKFSQEKTGIVNLLDAETEISKLTGMFSSLSTIPQKAFRVFSRILGDAQNKRDNLFNKDYEELSTLRKEYVEWARSKGYSDKDLFKPLLDYNAKGEWTGKFLKKYQSEFYKKMQDAVQSEDVTWLIDNTEFNEEKFNKDKIRQKEFYETIVYDPKNEKRNKELQEEAYKNWLEKHDVNIGGKNKNKKAYLNMDNYNGKKVLNSYLKPKEKWKTEQWKKLEASPIALKTYNFFQDLLKRSNKAGLIDDYSPAFIPNISRNKLEQFVFGGDMFSKKGIFESLEVESGESPFAPQINPITGAIEHSIPTHYIRDMGVEREDGTLDYSQKSMDLFRVFGIWSAQLANYQSMSEIEDKARLLLFVEKNKSHIEINPFGKPVFESGIKKEIPGNEINSQLLSEFINYYFYNIQSGKMGDRAFKIGDKEYSANKVLGWMTRFFSLKTLALNPMSGTANFVGGMGNAFFQASKGIIFNTADWASSIYDVTRRSEIAFGLLGVADVLIEGRKGAMINKLSVSSIINANTIDKAYFMMRASDKAVQYPIAIAIMKNHMVDENDKIVDIKTYVKAKYNYNESFYSLPKSEQDSIRKKIEDEVKTLKDTKSIYTTAKIVNDKIEIPGVDLQSEQWGRFRLKIKKVSKNVLGNSTRDDINSIRTGMLGSMAMQFRSWMPQMVQERFGKLKYDQDLEVHTMGKFNLWIGELFSKRAPQLLTGIINSSGTNMIEAAKQKYLLLKAEAVEKGEEFTITEGEFVDMYIGNIKSMYREFLMIIGIGALMFTILSDDDDDDQDVGLRTYAARAFRKYFDEFSFFYSAPSWSNLVNKPLPVVGLADDFYKFTKSVFNQGYGFVLNDEDILEKAKPAKYLSRMMPIFKEGIQIRAIFDDDFRKEWDIRFNVVNR